jgi:hypothetical protein
MDLPTSMKAIRLFEYVGPAVLKYPGLDTH